VQSTAYKRVPFELTELKSGPYSWTFTGYASTFGNVDLGGDVVLPGAFADSLKLHPKPRLLWGHDTDEPIGVPISLTEDDRGLRGEWKLSKTNRGQDAYTLLKDGAIDSLSIGYVPIDSEFSSDGIRKLKALDLREVSLVALPMNESAVVTAVKAAASVPLAAHFERVLEEVRLLTDRCVALVHEGKSTADAAVDRFKVEMPAQLLALAAEIQGVLNDAGSDVAPTGVRDDDPSQLTTTQLRLRILRKRLRTADDLKDVWTTAYVNSLPDSSFAAVYTDANGTKQRKLPHHNSSGALDAPHLRNALSREPQTDMPATQHSKAKAHLSRHAKAEGIGSD
jgi:HK97 family phage prohead protease